MGRLPWVLGTVLSIAASTVAFGAPARAAEGTVGVATVSGTKVRYKAAYTGANRVVITRSGRTLTIDDKKVIKTGKGCKAVKGDKTKVRCTTAKTPTRVTVTLYDGNDVLDNRTDVPMTAYGEDGNDRIYGGSRGDSIDGGHGADRLYGRAGNDRIDGSFENDLIHGGVGHDTIFGDWGDDTLYGGAGNDRFHADRGNDRISGEDGADWADGASGNDVYSGGNGDDGVLGGTGNDVLSGDAGNDWLDGQQGADRLSGGAGNDDLSGDDARLGAVAADVLLGGAGFDKVAYDTYRKPVTVDLDGATGDDGQAGERDTVGADVEGVYGGVAGDRLTGSGVHNFLNGMAGDDIIRGGAGNDEIDGSDGRDSLHGDAGDDLLIGYELSGPIAADRIDGGVHGTAGDSCLYTQGDTLVECEIRQAYS
ncbi:calcium-binding protein [Actinoplanes teichomyceticus]|uniref:Hemolysin type calcium-binding protein n=1 Tax=Actinoplanes teichomyceticus TaxID=1867 RepID=A0A561WR07_ACTTI|nr:calcium-binding protein [Actinoplanes teichomyceticus]TWG26268.1 hemolysin type calcium-binding protein [Actinoplanes teichomyceticus]